MIPDDLLDGIKPPAKRPVNSKPPQRATTQRTGRRQAQTNTSTPRARVFHPVPDMEN